jgi:hypothetical protein
MTEKRAFTDREGVRWNVTVVAPQQNVSPIRDRRKLPRMAKRPPSASMGFQTRDLMLPWLRFESRADIRAIEPAPLGWETLSDSELEDLLGRSTRLNAR